MRSAGREKKARTFPSLSLLSLFRFEFFLSLSSYCVESLFVSRVFLVLFPRSCFSRQELRSSFSTLIHFIDHCIFLYDSLQLALSSIHSFTCFWTLSHLWTSSSSLKITNTVNSTIIQNVYEEYIVHFWSQMASRSRWVKLSTSLIICFIFVQWEVSPILVDDGLENLLFCINYYFRVSFI